MGLYKTSYGIEEKALNEIILDEIDFENWDVLQVSQRHFSIKWIALGPISHLWDFLKIDQKEFPLFGHENIFTNNNWPDSELISVEITHRPMVSHISRLIEKVKWEKLSESYLNSKPRTNRKNHYLLDVEGFEKDSFGSPYFVKDLFFEIQNFYIEADKNQNVILTYFG
jgi:hypothetical protein